MAYDDPHWMGGIGMIGTKPVHHAVQKCDLLEMIGTTIRIPTSSRQKVMPCRSMSELRCCRRNADGARRAWFRAPAVATLLENVKPKTDTR